METDTNIDYLICIPIYRVTDRIYKCLESIKDKNVLLIDNSGNRECEVFEKQYGFQVEYQSENIGLARAWNIGLKKGHDWTFVVSSSMLFNKPFSHIIEMLKGFNGVMFRTQHGWHLCGINKKLVSAIGYFDENFYPYNFDDCDWDHRCLLLEEQLINDPESDVSVSWRDYFPHPNAPISYVMRISAEAAEVDVICQVDGGATIDGLKINIDGVHDYFKSKWGGDRTREGWGEYKYPFNDPTKSLDYWPINDIATLKKNYGLK
jgi:glycosyltransferase involved in cell wall biosynthesis